MARKNKAINNATWFYPDGYAADEDTPFRVLLTPMTGADLRRLERDGFGHLTKKKVNLGEMIQARINKIISERVEKVEGYALLLKDVEFAHGKDLDAEGYWWPVNGAELVQAVEWGSAGDIEVLDKIFEALKDNSVLEEGLEGKSN